MFALNSLVIEIIVLSSVMNADTFRSYYFETEQICRTKIDVLSRKIHSLDPTNTWQLSCLTWNFNSYFSLIMLRLVVSPGVQIHVTETRYVLYAFDQNIPDVLKFILNWCGVDSFILSKFLFVLMCFQI